MGDLPNSLGPGIRLPTNAAAGSPNARKSIAETATTVSNSKKAINPPITM